MQTTPSMAGDMTDQFYDMINAIGVHSDAEYDMFAYRELFPEDLPANRLVNEGGGIREWEIYSD